MRWTRRNGGTTRSCPRPLSWTGFRCGLSTISTRPWGRAARWSAWWTVAWWDSIPSRSDCWGVGYRTSMTKFGYTLMTEQSGPNELVRYAGAAEEAGFDFEVMSDHYSPWLTEQGHSPYAWSVLGAVAHATSRVGLMTYITCPTMRYHPAVVAQKAATMALLSGGRFTLGLGSGENLNEHTVGRGWPGLETRHEMLAEAIEVICELHAGDLVTRRGTHFAVDSARIWDLPREPIRLAVAVAGPRAVERFAPLA